MIVTREERVLRITLDRPAKRNALDSTLCQDIVSVAEAAESDASVGAILIDAQGDVFCAGMDLDEVAAPDAAEKTVVHAKLFTLGARLRKPIVAAINGPALGGGVGLIANAHIAVAAHGASFGLTEIRLGMWPYVVWQAVSSAVGERRAMALALTGRIFSVNEAVQWGLVHEVTPPFELDDRATAIAMHVANNGPEAMRLGMEFAQGVRSAADPIAFAVMMRQRAFASEDFREGIGAFRERRKPDWFRRD